MISSIEWIPKGVADPSPKRYEMSAAEQELLHIMQKEGTVEQAERKVQEMVAKNSKQTLPKVAAESLPADLRMDEYSSDEGEDGGMVIGSLLVGKEGSIPEDVVPSDEQDDNNAEVDDDGGTDVARGALNASDTVSDGHSDDSDDDLADVPDTREYTPIDVEGLEAMGLSHVGISGPMYMDQLGEGEDEDSEAEDVRLTEDDALVVVAKTEEDFASLEVHVYEQKTGNLYVHHDIPLPAFPLCLAHGQVSCSGTAGNFCAVGTFSPGIEIWNLDVLNALEPSCILGGEDTSSADELLKMQMMAAGKTGRLPHKPSEGGLRPGSHTDAVMALSWNSIHRQVIASGSADCTVKLWDVTQAGPASAGECSASTLKHHRDKVQSVVWHPKEGTLLATGSFDRTVVLLDARSGGENVKSVKITADCEALAWDPHHPELLTVASEDGTITCWDVRKFETSTPFWSLVANEFGGINDLSYNTHVPGMMATCSIDKSVTLWDTYNQNGAPAPDAPPRLCGSKDMCSGKLYTVAFYPSSPWLVGSGGSGNQLALWDLSAEEAIQRRFRERAGTTDGVIEEADMMQEEDFEAMMAKKDQPSRDSTNVNRKKKKAKGKNSKKKAHRKGR